MSRGAGGWEIELLHRMAQKNQKTQTSTTTSSASANQTIYLTFDDGPAPGTDDVIAVLEAKQVRGTLFMVANHASTAWRKTVVQNAHASVYVEVANHSKTHAGGKYANYYSDPAKVVKGFLEANDTLGLSGSAIPARLPGRNTWRVGDIAKNDLGSGPAADKLKKAGFQIYGWDVEWRMDSSGKATETAAEVFAKIKKSLSSATTKKKDKVMLLTHDVMFKGSTGGKAKLEVLVDLLLVEGYQFDFVSNY